MVTNAGGGYSRWQDIALTRWREDSTRDNWGTFFYVKDVNSGNTWSTTLQPCCRPLDRYEVTYSQGIAEFRASRIRSRSTPGWPSRLKTTSNCGA